MTTAKATDNSKYMKFVFVYGNQMKGFKGNDLLSKAKFVGSFMTKDDHFSMCICNGVPCAFETVSIPAGGKLRGEVYKVSEDVAKELESRCVLPNISYASSVELKGFKKRARVYFIFDPPVGDKNQHTFVLDKPTNGVYDWKAWIKLSKERADKVVTKKEEKTNVTNNQQSANQNVPTVFNPIVKLKDGTEVNRGTLAYELLQVHDAMDFFLSESNMTDADRGVLLREEMEKFHALARKVNGVL